jgi:hypothetical protein
MWDDEGLIEMLAAISITNSGLIGSLNESNSPAIITAWRSQDSLRVYSSNKMVASA